jgi:hypothetical protein
MTQQISFLIGTLLLLQVYPSAQNRPDMNEPSVQAGIVTLRPDGNVGSSAMLTGDRAGADLAGTVYLAPCSTVGAADFPRPVSAAATEVWQLSGKILELNSDQASIQVTWQRTRRDGRDEPSLPQSLTLTLKRGQRSALESISLPATGSCAERKASLDVAFLSRSGLYSSGAGATVFNSVRADGSQGRVYTSRTSGTSVFVRSTDQPAPAELTADLWLVRSTPGRADETLHLTMPVQAMPQPFAFAPMTIQTPSGAIAVKIEGTLEIGRASDGDRRFYFSATRTVTRSSSGQPARDATVVESSLKMTVTMPGPEEVLSFDMPQIRMPGGAAVPDQLSIRVKLTPVSMREVTKPR